MDHVGVVVEDLDGAAAFFHQLGLRTVGETGAEGDWVDRVIGLERVRARVVMLETPDGHARVELSRFDTPQAAGRAEPAAANEPGIRHLCFEVQELDSILERTGAELVGEVARYEDSYRLCYVRGPEGILVELAERIA